MSWKATAYIKDLRQAPNGQALTRTEKLVLFVLADCFNPDYHCAWPSVKSLARAALVSDRHIRRILRSLEAKGAIQTTESRGLGHTNCYRFPGFSPDATTTKPDTASGLSHSKTGPAKYRNRTLQPAKSDGAASGEPKGTETRTEDGELHRGFYERQLNDLKRTDKIGDFSRRVLREQLSDPVQAASMPEWFRNRVESLLKV